MRTVSFREGISRFEANLTKCDKISLRYSIVFFVWPPPSKSDHQDPCRTCLVGDSRDSPLNSHLPLLLGGGHTQSMSVYSPEVLRVRPWKMLGRQSYPGLGRFFFFRGKLAVQRRGCIQHKIPRTEVLQVQHVPQVVAKVWGGGWIHSVTTSWPLYLCILRIKIYGDCRRSPIGKGLASKVYIYIYILDVSSWHLYGTQLKIVPNVHWVSL